MLLFVFYLLNTFNAHCMSEIEYPAYIPEKIESHYKGTLFNLHEIYTDIPALIVHAQNGNNKALCALIAYKYMHRFYFDHYAYQTPTIRKTISTIPWNTLPLNIFFDSNPISPDEELHWGLYYYQKFFNKFRNHKKYSTTQGLQLIKKAANSNSCKALHCLGCIHMLNNTMQEALSCLQKAAILNYSPSLFEFGFYLHKKNDPTGLELIEKAAKQNYSTAQFYLGLIYEKKMTAQPAYFETAHRYYLAAMKLGCLQAQHNLGLLHLTKKYTTTDPQEGLRLINDCIAQEYAPSQFFLGKTYYHTNQSAPLKQAGVVLLKQAAHQNHHKAQYILAMRMLHGDEIIKQDIAEAIHLLKKASEADAQAQYQLGVMYIHNIYIERDFITGITLLKKSAGKKYSKAINELKDIKNFYALGS